MLEPPVPPTIPPLDQYRNWSLETPKNFGTEPCQGANGYLRFLLEFLFPDHVSQRRGKQGHMVRLTQASRTMQQATFGVTKRFPLLSSYGTVYMLWKLAMQVVSLGTCNYPVVHLLVTAGNLSGRVAMLPVW